MNKKISVSPRGTTIYKSYNEKHVDQSIENKKEKVDVYVKVNV